MAICLPARKAGAVPFSAAMTRHLGALRALGAPKRSTKPAP
jgi:hypothetical protein